jgi:O-antigen/teichoic acid export membrane protein
MQVATPRALWTNLRSNVLEQRLFRDVGVLTAANVVDAGLSVLQGMLVARWLGPELYGVAALVMTYPALLFTFLDPRASDASVKYLGEFSSRRERERASAMCTLGWVVDLLTALVALLAVAATAGWAAAHVVRAPEVVLPMVLFTAAFVPRALAGTATAALTTLGRFHLLATATVLQAVVRTALVLGLVSGGAGVAGVVYGNAVAVALSGVGLTLLAYPLITATWGRTGVARAWTVLAGHRRSIFSFLLYNDVNAFLGAFVKQADLLFLGWLRGPTDAGYYRLAKSLGTTLGLVVAPLQSTTYPRFARLWGLDRQDELRAVVRRYAWSVGAPLGATVLVALPLVPSLIVGVVGERYLSAAPTAQLVLAGAALWVAGFWVRPYLMAVGRIGTFTRLYLISLVPYAVSFAFLARTFGPAGMAMGFLGHNLLLFAVPALQVLR